jgi:hypothetical protein
VSKKDKLRQIVNKQAASARESDAVSVVLTSREALLAGIGCGEKNERPYVNLRYYCPKHQCLSAWQPDELRAFSDFCRKLTAMRWAEIYKTGGQLGYKTGLGYTVHKDHSVLPSNPDIENISPELTWFELRVTTEARVHGFRMKDAFYLVFLDREHAVYR